MSGRTPKDARGRELGRIHILAKQLKLTRDQYEAVLWTQARVESSANLDDYGRKQVIKHLEAHAARQGINTARPRQRSAQSKSELVSKIRAQLMSFTPPRPDAYADGMAQRMFKVDQFTWCEPAQLWKLIAALSYDQQRRGAPRI